MSKCKSCYYWRVMKWGKNFKACHYCYETGKMRGCPPDKKCDKYIKGDAKAFDPLRKTNNHLFPKVV